MTAQRVCGSCRFWSEPDGRTFSMTHEPLGTCRVDPKQWTAQGWRYPEVAAEDGCSRWKGPWQTDADELGPAQGERLVP